MMQVIINSREVTEKQTGLETRNGFSLVKSERVHRRLLSGSKSASSGYVNSHSVGLIQGSNFDAFAVLRSNSRVLNLFISTAFVPFSRVFF